MATKKKPAKAEHTDQMERDQVSKLLLRAQMAEITTADVKAYTTILFAPKETSEAQKKRFAKALFKFAALGWTLYHAAHDLKESRAKS